jgi:hypothetical protein
MARPRNTDVDPPEPVMTAEATVEPSALLAEVVVPAPAAAKEPPPPTEQTPQQPLVPPPETPARLKAVTAAATKPGLRQIGKGDQIRQVHPVDVADWLTLGWQVLPANELPS